MENCPSRNPKHSKLPKNPINRYIVMLVVKSRWVKRMEEVRDYTDYCVYIDVADSFFVVIIKLKNTSVSLRYLSKQSHLAMAIREDK